MSSEKSEKKTKEVKVKPPNLSRKNAGVNWDNSSNNLIKTEEKSKESNKLVQSKALKNVISNNITKYIGMDCEMVGVGPEGVNHMLARVSLVNQKGEVLLDKYVKAREPVTDYRTKVSGIRPEDMERGEDFDKVQDEVVNIIQGNILVGHSIKKDLSVLYLNHPHKNIRDTAKYKPLAKLVSNGAVPSLKKLAKTILGLDIQEGEHDSVIDARVTMQIYNRFSADWEKLIHKLEQRQKHRNHKHKHVYGKKK